MEGSRVEWGGAEGADLSSEVVRQTTKVREGLEWEGVKFRCSSTDSHGAVQ